MQNSFQSLIEAANSILVLLPKNPTLDQVASGLSVHLSLSEKKSVNIVCSTPMTVDLNKLVGVNRISEDLGNKNLLIKFTNYQANDIERVNYDIEGKEFMLSVIPKAGMSAPTKDQVNITYSGVTSDLVILIGGVNESHYPAISESGLKEAKKLHIGTRQLTFAGQYQILSFVQPFSSISEVVANLLIQAKFKIDADVSTNLIAGIEGGSDRFTTGGVAAETFQLIYELMRSGGKRVLASEGDQKTFPPGAIPGQIPQPVQPQPSVQPGVQPGAQQQPIVQSSVRPGAQQQPVVQPDSTTPTSGTIQHGLLKPEDKTKDLSKSSVDSTDIKDQESSQEPPKDWLEPKIYKGSSINKG